MPHKERIEFKMSMVEIIEVMGERNMGATTALTQIMTLGSIIDPDDALMGYGAVLNLDTIGVYGHDIYRLWDYVCSRDLGKMLSIIRAWQLGQLAGCTAEAIIHAIENNGEGLDLDAIVKAVEADLPNFHADALGAPA